jgi:hypothetical protein
MNPIKLFKNDSNDRSCPKYGELNPFEELLKGFWPIHFLSGIISLWVENLPVKFRQSRQIG